MSGPPLRISALAGACIAICCLVQCADAAVRVKREAPVVEYKTFDPADPPADMPKLEPGEAAVTSSDFRCEARADYELISRKAGPDGVTAVVGVRGMIVSTRLRIVVYLPQAASEKLKAHEEGHRKLAEKIYLEQAERAARAAGGEVDGKRLTGVGADWKAAAQNAVSGPIQEIGQHYLARTADRSSQVNQLYDVLTAHGTNSKSESDAMAEALASYEKEHPATQPVKSK